MSQLFTPLRLRGLTIRNRVFVSPMCMYSAQDGLVNDFHLVHLGARALGGAGLVIAEATGVTPEGRITPFDTGLWNDEQGEAWARVVRFVKASGAAAGIQLAHAGRKASTDSPWKGGAPLRADQGAWQTIGPSPIPFAPGHPAPREMTPEDIDAVVDAFVAAARRAIDAGFDVVEVHSAHGYLLHQFLSPISNRRTDGYGGSFENRVRLTVRVAEAVRAAVPDATPVFVRISATDWVEGAWDLEQSVELAKHLRAVGVDLIDCSSGGASPEAQIPVAPGYQVPFAEAIRDEAGIATGAVGMITEPEQAEEIVASGKADAVLLARAMLQDPHWALHAAAELDADAPWPAQYGRAGGRRRRAEGAAR